MTGIKETKIDELQHMQKQLKTMLWVVLICFAAIIFFMLSGIEPFSRYWWDGIPIGITIAFILKLFSNIYKNGRIIKYIEIGSLLSVMFWGCLAPFEMKPMFNGLLWGMFPLYFALNYKKGPVKKFINMWQLAKTK